MSLKGDNDEQSISQLLGGIIQDAQKLVRQELALARAELQNEWNKLKGATKVLALAVGALGVAALLFAFSLVHVLSDLVQLPAWASYLIVTFLFAGIGLSLYFKGRDAAAKVDFMPRETVETLKENVEWIRNQT